MATRREIEMLLKLRDEITSKLKEIEKHLKGVEKAKKGVESAATSTGAATKRLAGDLDRGLRRALQQTAQQGGFVTSALSKMGPVGLAAAASVGAFVLGLRNLVQESVRLTTEANKLNLSVEEYQRLLGITVVMTNEAAAAGTRLSKAWDDFSKSLSSSSSNALGPYAEKLAGILETITKISALKPGQSLSELFAEPIPKAFVGAAKPTAGTMADAERATKERLRAEKEYAQELEKTLKWIEQQASSYRIGEIEGKRYWESLKQEAEDYQIALETIASTMPAVIPDIPLGMGLGTPGIPNLARQNFQPLAMAPTNVDFSGLAEADKQLDEFGLSLESAADLAQVFGDQMGGFGNALIQGAAAGDLLSDAFDDIGENGLTLANAMAAAVGIVAAGMAIANATSTGTQGQRAGKGALAGAQAGGQIAGPLGAAVGAAAGAIVGWLRGRGPAQVGEDAGRDIGAALSQALMEEIHKSGENAQMFLREIFEEGGLGLDRLAEEVGDLFSFFERGEISEAGLLGELEELLPILIENFGALGETGKAQIDRILGAAAEMGIELGAAGDALERLAAGIPETTLEGLADALGVSVERARELAELLGKNMQTDLERLADDMDVPVELLEDLAEALQIPIDKLDELLETMNMTAAEAAAALGIEVPEGAGTPENDPAAVGQAMAGEVGPVMEAAIERAFARAGDKLVIAIRDAVAQGP